jgi:hypothetical protein
MRKLVLALLASTMISATHASAATGDTARIIDEGMNRSQVMLTASELMDGVGPRMTNSPNMRRAEQWAIGKFQSYGLTNVHREGFDFGRGWEIVDSSVVMTAPRRIKLTAIPIAWSPPTDGVLKAPIIVAPMNRKEQFAAYRGKLRGKIVLIDLPGTGDEPAKAAFQRLDSGEVGKLDKFEQPTFDPDFVDGFTKRIKFWRDVDLFLASEGAVAWVRKSYRDGKLVSGEGYQNMVGQSPKLPAVEIAAEDYRRLARLAKTGGNPELEINSNVRYVDDDRQGYNVIADLPGTDPKAGYVMAGAHLDSWAAGDGASDNGAGSVVVVEAARLLRQLGVRPKRTIRFVLWAGEEQGLFGSLSYIEKHIAVRPYRLTQDGTKNYDDWAKSYPITPLAGYGDLKAYFNLDNGSGKVRGIYAEGNTGASSLLKEWLAPFDSMGADAIVAAPTDGTDHQFFQTVGLPAYQFIQDPLDYGSRVHHSNIDTLDHMKAEDLRQAAVVMAGVLLQAANSDKELPRQPLRTQPLPTDPFKYDYPEPK